MRIAANTTPFQRYTAREWSEVGRCRGDRAILSYVLKRSALSLATLWLLSLLVFAGGRMLPGNVGRAMLGPFADQKAVDVLNHEMGTDRPLLVQYGDWISGLVTGDLGMSYAYRSPMLPPFSPLRWQIQPSWPRWLSFSSSHSVFLAA